MLSSINFGDLCKQFELALFNCFLKFSDNLKLKRKQLVLPLSIIELLLLTKLDSSYILCSCLLCYVIHFVRSCFVNGQDVCLFAHIAFSL